jgi:hypothetical protein
MDERERGMRIGRWLTDYGSNRHAQNSKTQGARMRKEELCVNMALEKCGQMSESKVKLVKP